MDTTITATNVHLAPPHANTTCNHHHTVLVALAEGHVKGVPLRKFTCPYASCIDCCSRHSNGALAGPDLVGGGSGDGGGGCSCMLLVLPTPTCPDAGPDLCTLCWCCFLPSTGTNTPLALMVVITCCNLCWWCFFLQPLAHILHLQSCNLHCVVGVLYKLYGNLQQVRLVDERHLALLHLSTSCACLRYGVETANITQLNPSTNSRPIHTHKHTPH